MVLLYSGEMVLLYSVEMALLSSVEKVRGYDEMALLQ